MKMTQRLLAVLLTLCMVVALVPAMVFTSAAADPTVSVVNTSVQLGEATEVTVTVVADGAWAEEDELLVKYDTATFTWGDADSVDADTFELSKGSRPKGYAITVDCWTEGEYTDTVVGTVTFEIAENATAGDYEFTVDGEKVGTVTILPGFEYDGMTFRIMADKTVVEPGDTFTLTYKLYGIPSTGLTEYEFFNIFDEDTFEFVSATIPSSIEGLTNYGTVNESQKMLCGTVSPDHFLGDSVLGTATFKVKDTAAAGEYLFDIDRTEQDPTDPAWKACPTTFSHCEVIDGEKTMVPYLTPVVATATVTVAGTVEPTVWTVQYVVEGVTVFEETFEEGTTEPKYTETPTKAEDMFHTYEFSEWFRSEEGTTITYTALFIANDKAGELEGKIVILHTNDVHGAVEGYAYIAALKAEYEAKGATVILADAGDYSQGTTYVSTTKGADAIAMMNAVGYDIATLGNHEFDYGYPQLAENLKAAGFTVVCADVVDSETGDPIFGKGHVIIEKDGVKIGFFGLETPEAQTKANPALIQGLTFFAGVDLDTCVNKEIEALKEEGADLVIALAHLGVDNESAPYRSTDIYAKATGLDFMIDGHSHTVMTEGPNGEKIQSTGTAFANIGVIVIDAATKTIVDNYLVPVTEDSAKDETVAAEAKKIVDRVNAEYGEVFAESKVDLNGDKAPGGNRDSETNNGDLITDAMIWALTEQNPGSIAGVDADNIVAITNGGGIRAWIYKGDVTKNDVLTVLPFGNTLSVVYVTGAELLEALEASTYCTPTSVGGFPQIAGMNIEINTALAYDPQDEPYPASTYYGPKSIKRVTILDVNGKEFDPDATYAVITNNFCAAGGDTYYAFAAATSQFDTGRTLDTVVMDYITEKLEGVIGEEYAAPQGRIELVEVLPTEYTVKYVVDGTVVFEKTFEEGAAEPAYTETPAKDATAQYTYTFDKWEKTVEGDVITYTAKFIETVNKYTVTFKDGEKVLGEYEYEYGATIDYVAPDKLPTAEYTYTFKCFEPELTVVTGDAVYQVVYTETPVVPPVEPTEKSVSAGTTTVQLGETDTVTVTITVNGAFEEEEEVAIKYDTDAFSYSDAESADADLFEISKGGRNAGYPILVDCWTEGEYADFAAGTVTLEIAENAVAGTYELTVDGEVVGTIELLPAASYDEMTLRIMSDVTDLKPGDTFTVTYKIYSIPETGLTEYEFFNIFDEDVFEFVSAEVPSTIEGLTLYGTVNPDRRMLCGTVMPNFFYGDTVLGTATFKVKDDAATGDYVLDIDRTEQDPTDPAWKEFPTTFSYGGEDGKMVPYATPVVDTLTVHVESETPVEPTIWTVKYVVEGAVVFEETFEEGTEEPTYTETPTKAEDETYTYEFAGWDKKTEETTVTYTAVFTAIEKPVEPPVEPTVWTVKYVVEGAVVFEETFEEGTEEPTYTETPVKAEDETYTYEFKEWTKTEEGTVITYTAEFTATEKPVEPPVEPTVYTVKYVVEGEVVFEETFEEGTEEPTYTETPVKAEDETYTYEFKEWTKTEEGTVITYTAEFTATEKPVEPPVEPKTITVKYVVDGKVVFEATYTEGEEVPAYEGETPTKAADDKFTYTFDGWKETVGEDGTVTYEPIFKATPKTGDVYNTVLWAVLLVSCAAVVAVATVAKKKIED